MAAYEAQGKAEKKGEKLKERREKLAVLLAEERDMYEVGKKCSPSTPPSLSLSPCVTQSIVSLGRVQGLSFWEICPHEASVVSSYQINQFVLQGVISTGQMS